MKPWQILLLVALVLNGLCVAALALVSRSDLINSVLAGALLPVAVSTALLIWAGHLQNPQALQLQKLNIIGFLMKVILLGLWAVILLKSGSLDKVTFIVTLLINFLAWHGVEAYYWPLFVADVGRNKGENS